MSLRALIDLFWGFMDAVAGVLIGATGRLRSPRTIRLVEQSADTFAIETARGRASSARPDARVRIIRGSLDGALAADVAAAFRGSRVELVLQPNRFLFRPLELPKRAAEFLEGIVRAQIDRLTPWSASDAVFGWTSPSPIEQGQVEKDRIRLTVVATARTLIAPYLQALTGLGVGSVIVSVMPQGADVAPAPVKVLEHSAKSALGLQRLRSVLAAVFIVTGLSAGIAAVSAQFVVDGLDAQQQELARQIAERRTAMRREGVGGAPPVQRLLDRRKRETPSSVMVIEALSRILPDHTYVTELRIEGDKLQVIGITRDAPSLIRLIEQSAHFTRATFFAPTTRSAGDPGERFHIEARIKPVFSART